MRTVFIIAVVVAVLTVGFVMVTVAVGAVTAGP